LRNIVADYEDNIFKGYTIEEAMIMFNPMLSKYTIGFSCREEIISFSLCILLS
jgi:hypothetical protein